MNKKDQPSKDKPPIEPPKPQKDEPPIEPPKPPRPEKDDPRDPDPIGDVNVPQSDVYDPAERKDPEKRKDKPIKEPPRHKR